MRRCEVRGASVTAAHSHPRTVAPSHLIAPCVINSFSSAAVLSRTGPGVGGPPPPRAPRPRPPPPPPGTPIATSSGVRPDLSLRSSFAPCSARKRTSASPRLTAMCSAVSPLSLTALTSAPLAMQQRHRVNRALLGSGVPPGSRRGNHQRRGLVAQPEIRVGALVEQHADDRRVADLRRSHQRRGALAELRVAAAVLPHQQRRLERWRSGWRRVRAAASRRRPAAAAPTASAAAG